MWKVIAKIQKFFLRLFSCWIFLLFTPIVQAISNPVVAIVKNQVEAYQQFLCASPAANKQQCLDQLVQQRNQLIAVKQSLIASLTDIFTAENIDLQCDVNNNQVVLESVIQSVSSKQLSDRLAQLNALAYKPLLSAIESQELLDGMQNGRNSPNTLQQLCRAYNQHQTLLSCAAQLSVPIQQKAVNQCLSLVENKTVKNVMLVEAAVALNQYLPEMSPFIERELVNQQQNIEAGLSDYILLQTTLSDLVTKAIEAYLKWQSQVAVVLYLAEQDPVIMNLIGLSSTQFKRLAKQLTNDQYKNIKQLSQQAFAQSKFQHQHHLLTKKITQFEKQTSLLVNDAIKQFKKITKNQQQALQQPVVDYAFQQTTQVVKDLLGSVNLAMDFEQQEDLVNEQTAYKVSLYYQLNQQNINLKMNCTKGSLSCRDHSGKIIAATPKSNVVNERVELGIYIDDIGITKSKKDDFVYQYIGPNLRANTRIDAIKLKQALIKLGLPKVFQLENLNFEASADLKNISLMIPIKILGYQSQKALRLTVLKDGKAVAPGKAIKTFIIETAKTEIDKALFYWVKQLPYVAKDKVINAGVWKVKLAKDIEFNYVVDSQTIQGQFNFLIHQKKQLLGSVPIQFELNEKGIIFKKVTFDKNLRSILSNTLKQQIKSLINSDVVKYIEQVTPLLNMNQLGFKLTLSGELLGCRIDTEVYLDYRLTAAQQLLNDSLTTLKQQATTCAKQKAIALAWKQLPAIDFTQPLNLFGIEFQYLQHQRLSANNYLVSVEATFNDQSLTIEQLPLTLKDGRLIANFSQAKLRSKDAEQYFQKRLQPLFNVLPNNLMIEKVGLDQGGIYFYATLIDVPYLGDVNLGKLFIAGFANNLQQTVLKASQVALTRYIEKNFNGALSVPDLGPIENITPAIKIDPKLVIGINAQLKIYNGIKVPLKIDLLPFKVYKPNVSDTLKTSLLGVISELAPSQLGVFKFTSKPQLSKLPEHGVYGLSFGAEINLGFLSVVFERVAISSKGIILPEEVGAALPANIQLGYVVISKAGIVYNTRKPGLIIIGEITAVNATLAHIAKIQSKLDLTDIGNARFVLTGNLIAANTLSILKARGEVALKEAYVTYEAHTNPMFKSIIQAESEGLIDGQQQIFSTHSSLALLGLKLNESDFLINVPKNIVRFTGGERLLIGWADFGVKTNTQFKSPAAHASFELDLSGWKALHAELNLSLALAQLKMKVLGIGVTVITPSVKGLTPRLLLNILSNLLKVDIKSLLKMKLNDITVSVLDSQGNVQQISQSSSQSAKSQQGKGKAETKKGADKALEKSVRPKERASKTTSSTTGGSTIGKIAVNNYCLKISGKNYVYQQLPVNTAKPTFPTQALHNHYTFNEQAKQLLCGNGDQVKTEWIEVHKKNHQKIEQCDSLTNRWNYRVQSVLSQYAPKAEKTLFCGVIERPVPKCYQQQLILKGIENISIEDYKAITSHKKNQLKRNQYRWYFNRSKKENSLYKKAYQQLKNKKICSQIRNLKLNYRFDDGFFVDDYEVSAIVKFKPYTTQIKWRQHFKLFYNTTKKKYYALSSCIQPSALEEQDYSITEFQKKVCKAGLFALPSVPGYETAIQKKAIILSNAHEYYLLDDAAATFSQTGELPKIKPMPVDFSLNKVNYRGTEFLPSNGINYKNYYITVAQKKSVHDVTFTVDQKNPLYPWLLPELYRNELIAQLANQKTLDVWYADLAQQYLILADKKQVKNNVTTYWMRKGKPPVTVKVTLDNPYRKGQVISNVEKKRLIETVYNEIIQSQQSVLNLTLGLDRRQQLEILLIHSAENFKMILSQSSHKLLANPQQIKTKGRNIQGDSKALTQCLKRIGIKQSIVDVFKDPGAIYQQLTPQMYPLKLLDITECTNAQ